MRTGDTLILLTAILAVVLLFVDAAGGGSVSAWADQNLYPLASVIGGFLISVGRYAWPLLLLPLISGVAGRFAKLPPVVERINRALIRIIDSLTLQIGGAARWLALGLVLVTATIVIQRYVFGFASTKLQESVIYMHALLFLLASASTLLTDGHVRVDVFFSKASDRSRAWTDLAGIYLALLPMCALILWSSTGYMDATWRVLEQSRESDGLPFVFLLKTAIPLFASLMMLQGLSLAARAAITLSGGTPPERPKLEGEVEV